MRFDWTRSVIEWLGFLIGGWLGMNVTIWVWGLTGLLIWPLWLGWMLYRKLKITTMLVGLVFSVGIDVVIGFRAGLSWLLTMMVIAVLGQRQSRVGVLVGMFLYGIVLSLISTGGWRVGLINGVLLLMLVLKYQKNNYV